MTTYIADVETDGLLDELTLIHSLVLIDADTEEVTSCADHEGNTPIDIGIAMLNEADTIVFHNGVRFDDRALRKVRPDYDPKGVIRDTMVLARIVFGQIKERDAKRVARGKLPGKLVGSHSLKAWGMRLGLHKGDFDGGDWQHWSQEMQDYCVQDCRVTLALWKALLPKMPTNQCVVMEHAFQHVCALMEDHGFPFDEEKAQDLYATLKKEEVAIRHRLQDVFPERWKRTQPQTTKKSRKEIVTGDWVKHTHTTKKDSGYFERGLGRNCEQARFWPGKRFVPVYNRWEEGAEFCKLEREVFNPASRQMAAARLIEAGWKPSEFTPSGQPKVDEETLKGVDSAEAKALRRYFLIQKRLGQLAEGKEAWLKKVKADGRIHGAINTNGAITGRCTHSWPNMGQIPSASAPFGGECRALFVPPKGMVQVGADLSGIELRCLAHYLGRWDEGAYAEALLAGDVHWMTVVALGLVPKGTERDHDNPKHTFYREKVAKRFVYAMIYGAGDMKLGGIVYPDAGPAEQRKHGKALRERLMRGIPGLGKLVKMVKQAAEGRGWLKGLDGRIIPTRSAHSALNSLLQGAGAAIAKMATVIAYEDLLACGYQFGPDWALMAHVHDELQCCTRPEIAEEVGRIVVEAMRKAGETFNMRIKIDGEYKIGSNWLDCH